MSWVSDEAGLILGIDPAKIQRLIDNENIARTLKANGLHALLVDRPNGIRVVNRMKAPWSSTFDPAAIYARRRAQTTPKGKR